MEFYGWRIKEWKFNSSSMEEQRLKMQYWIDKNRDKYEIRPIFINNSWAVEYRYLLKM